MFPRAPTATARRGLGTRGQTGNRTSTARNLENRTVKDVSFFKGKVYAKITELRTELNRVQKEINALQRQETAMSINAKQAQTMAEELTAKQGLLADLNTAVEKVSVGCSLSELQNELSELKKSNDKIEKEHDILYANRIDRQTKISEMNAAISTIQQDRAVLTSADYEAIKSNPRKHELAKLEVQMLNLETVRQSLHRDLNISETEDPEVEIAVMFEKLASLVGNKLNGISKRLQSFPKQEQYERFLAKNMSDFAHEDTTPLRLIVDLSVYLEQIKMIDRNMDTSISKFRDKTMDLKGVWSNSLNLADLDNSMNRKKAALANQKTNLECRNHSLQMTLDTRSAELENYHRQLMKSKDYSKICDLQLKLSNCRRINYDLEQYLEEGKSVQDLQARMERTLCVVGRLNEKFKLSLLDHSVSM